MSVHFKPSNRHVPAIPRITPAQKAREQAKAIVERRTLAIRAKMATTWRIRGLMELVHETFNGHLVPHGEQKRPDLAFHAKAKVRELGYNGGAEYRHACTAVKFARAGLSPKEREDSWKAAVQAVIPPVHK
jgi:hypothetical protein